MNAAASPSAPPRSPVPELEERRRDYQAAAAEARERFGALTGAQLAWRPEPGRWSIAECLDHLHVTGEEVLAQVDAAIARGRARGLAGSPPFRYGWLGPWFVRANSPSGRPVRAPGVFRPREGRPPTGALDDFLALQDELAAALERARGLDLARVRARSPVTPLLRIGIGSWFEVVAVHQRRHLAQARAVLEHPAFPRA
ncbi:MAG TPA: DinB family protein [Longimicrobiaceae bacterium]|jgi:hypothetical protein